jgi:hypothetical protein
MLLPVDSSVKASFASAANDASTLYLQFRINDGAFVQAASGKTGASADANWAEVSSCSNDNCSSLAALA